MIVARPPTTEYGSAQAGYVSRITTDVEPISALETQRDVMLRLLASASEERATA